MKDFKKVKADVKKLKKRLALAEDMIGWIQDVANDKARGEKE